MIDSPCWEDECECCGKIATVKVYNAPTKGFIKGLDALQKQYEKNPAAVDEFKERLAMLAAFTGVITTALWCDQCAERNMEFILSEEQTQRALAERLLLLVAQVTWAAKSK